MTKREEIVEALKSLIEGIRKKEGYETDIGKNVEVWRSEPFLPSELPCVNIMDYASYVEEVGDFHNVTLSFAIDVVFANEPMAVLRSAISDLKKAIFGDETLGGLAISTRYLGDEVEISQKEDKISVLHARVSVLYRVERWRD
ncbi:MAG: hypothetical protein RMJ39_10410 [Deltaproteobacteria bacterium]|nr:hypothetical protein [Deltaproteobacteria bacterium]